MSLSPSFSADRLFVSRLSSKLPHVVFLADDCGYCGRSGSMRKHPAGGDANQQLRCCRACGATYWVFTAEVS